MTELTIDSGGLIASDCNDRAVVVIFARALQRMQVAVPAGVVGHPSSVEGRSGLTAC